MKPAIVVGVLDCVVVYVSGRDRVQLCAALSINVEYRMGVLVLGAPVIVGNEVWYRAAGGVDTSWSGG